MLRQKNKKITHNSKNKMNLIKTDDFLSFSCNPNTHPKSANTPTVHQYTQAYTSQTHSAYIRLFTHPQQLNNYMIQTHLQFTKLKLKNTKKFHNKLKKFSCLHASS